MEAQTQETREYLKFEYEYKYPQLVLYYNEKPVVTAIDRKGKTQEENRKFLLEKEVEVFKNNNPDLKNLPYITRKIKSEN